MSLRSFDVTQDRQAQGSGLRALPGGPLVYLTGAWLLGVLSGALAGEVWWPAVGALATAGLAAALLERRWQLALLGLLAAALFVAGAWRYVDQRPPTEPTGIAVHNAGAPVSLRALVTDEPDLRGRSQRVRVAVRDVFVGGAWEQGDGGVLITTGLFPRYHYGDVVEIDGKLDTPPSFSGFDYREYLARQGVQSLAMYPKMHTIATGQGNAALEALHGVRRRLGDAIARVLPEPQAALAQGFLLGERASIPQSLTDEMNATGTSHLVAISGENVSLVAALIIAALAWLIGRRQAALVTLVAIAAYTALTGASPSVVRGAIMGELFVLATLVGRPASAPTSIALAAAIMTGLNPQVIHDVSFQLSFAAILGLVYLAPSLQTHGAALLRRWGIEAGEGGVAGALLESLSVTAGAVLSTAPLIALYFGRASLIAPLPNLLLVPAFPLILVSSALTAVTTAIYEPLGQVIGWFSWLTLMYMVETVRFFARLPLASLQIGGFGRWHAAIAYLALAAFAWWLARRRPSATEQPRRTTAPRSLRPIWFVAGGLAVAAACFWWAALQHQGGRLTVRVLDVGQGDAILIDTPDGHHVLVDGGASGLTLEERLGEALPFWERTIDLVALTHPQGDHISGLIDALERYDVREVLASPVVASTAAYQEWRALIADEQIPYYEAQPGNRIDLGGGATMRVLGPGPKAFASGKINNESLVLKLTWHNVSFLLTGDIEAGGEQALIDSGVDLHSTVLKVAHHGSDTSSSPAFLQAVQPAVAIVSVSANNPYGHPSPSVMSRFDRSLVLRTDQEGTIQLSTDGEHLWIEPERAP